MKKRRLCEVCHGTGRYPYVGYQVLQYLCPLCKGRGYLRENQDLVVTEVMKDKKEKGKESKDKKR